MGACETKKAVVERNKKKTAAAQIQKEKCETIGSVSEKMSHKHSFSEEDELQ